MKVCTILIDGSGYTIPAPSGEAEIRQSPIIDELAGFLDGAMKGDQFIVEVGEMSEATYDHLPEFDGF